MRIYTRTGDSGETGLFDGRRVSKNSLRVEAFGEVDELNALLGVALASEAFGDIRATLARLQSELFILGADLATTEGDKAGSRSVPRVTPGMVRALEEEIDRYESGLLPLRNFILPGGTLAGASLHLARCVARRAERAIVSLAGSEPIGEAVLSYSNRISDLLFVLARAANEHAQQAETPWVP